MTPATIRSYRDDDRDGVVGLWKACFPITSPHHDPEASLRRRRSVEDGLLLVAVENDTVVGTVMGGWDGHRGWLYSVAVSPNRRREGLGRSLVAEAIRRLADRDCPKVNLQVMPDNAEVIRFYEALGFAVENRISMGRRLPEAVPAG